MATRSSGLGTALIPGSAFDAAPVRFLQVAAIVMILVSTFGNYITWQGAERLWAMDDRTVWAVGGAVAWQVVCFLVQWGSRRNLGTFWWLYAIFLVASVAPATIGYWSVMGDWLTSIVGNATGAIALMAVTLAGNDAFPEFILVE